jgi:signal transduction histidine kinase
VLTIGAAGAPELVIAHDPALRDDPGLVSAATAAVRLAVENERLQAEVRAQLEAVQASRARIVEAQDDERRRIERDLHDGAQQRLVSLQLSLQMLRRDLGPDADPAAVAELEAASAEAAAAIADIRELARGVHPAILTEAGLGPALGSLAERAPLPVVVADELDRRLPGSVEATAYFVAAEALTNAIKHAGASRVDVRTWIADDLLHLDVRDDGRGGADIANGTGLTGVRDRVAAMGGSVTVESAEGQGTRLRVVLPCASP